METEVMANIKGMYLTKDLGDGTQVSLVNMKRPDDGIFALCLMLRDGSRTAKVFLEDIDSVSYAEELRDALTAYLSDRDEVQAEEDKRRASEHENLKQNRDTAKTK
jgi:hypothetical protein